MHSRRALCSNHIPWTIIGIVYVICPLILLYIRILLARENKRRDAEPVDDKYDDVYIEVVLPDGTRTERRVDKVRSRAASGWLVTHHMSAVGILGLDRYSESRLQICTITDRHGCNGTWLLLMLSDSSR